MGAPHCPHFGRAFSFAEGLSPNDERLALGTIRCMYEAEDPEALPRLIERRYWEAWWLLATLDATRKALGDEREDWFYPFLHAACARQEHAYRWALELPPAFPPDTAGEAASVYAVFADIILSGSNNPLGEWLDYAQEAGVPLPTQMAS